MQALSHPHMSLVVDVADEAVAAHLAQGWVQVVDVNTKPTQSDTKAAWVDYAVSAGLERADAESATKQDLIDLYT